MSTFGNMADLKFDAANVEPSSSFDPLPPGKYPVILEKSEIKATKAGTGSYMSLTFLIFEGDFCDRKVFSNINIKNPNKQAEDIGRRDLSALCRAVGVMAPKDSSELHDRPMVIKINISPAKDGYEAKNEIKEYSKWDEKHTAPPVPPPVTKPAPAPAKPWERKVK